MKILFLILGASFVFQPVFAFEGRIAATLERGGRTMPLLYTVGSNFLRVEVTVTNRPHPVDILNRESRQLTLLFPHNRSFVRLKNNDAGASRVRFDANLIKNQNSTAPPPGVGPTNLPGTSVMPRMPRMANPSQMPPPNVSGMPMMMPPMMEKMELAATGDKTNLLGLACKKYEIKQRGETMEIWATDRLFPFQPYVQNQPHRFGPRLLEQQWGDLLKAKQLFPLLAILKFKKSVERLRFEVKTIKPKKIKTGDIAKLFQPPSNYREIQPLPF